MLYQIDQSGKVEQTNKATVVALANGHKKTVKISGSEKQKLIKIMGDLGRPHKTYIYRIFSALVYMALIGEPVKKFLVDTEYVGHNAEIKEALVQLFEKFGQELPEINFGFVGKKSPAHKAGINVFRKLAQPDIVVTAEGYSKVVVYKNKTKRLETPVWPGESLVKNVSYEHWSLRHPTLLSLI